jgi:hypothetical protein
MKLQNINYQEFEYLIKKYGYKGIVKSKQFTEAGLDKKLFKQSDLSTLTSRISCYFNSD